jgi:methyl-accepting chemotaxis protein
MAGEKASGFGILWKMLLVMVLVASIPLGVVWYISHAASEQAISQDVDNRLSSTANQLRSYVESWIDMNVRVMRQNAKLPDMASMDGLRQKDALVSIVDTYEWDYLAFTIDINGQNVSRSDEKELKDYSDRHYVRQVLGGQELGQQVVISKTTGKPALILATAIKDAAKKTRGVLAIGMSLTDISQKVSSARFGKTGFAILLDPEGKVIAHINEDYTNQRTSLTDHPGFKALMLTNKESVVYTDETGKRIFSQARKTRHGWILLVQQDYDEAFSALKTYNQQTQMLMLVTLVLVLIVAVLVSRQLTRPIKRLTAAAEAISRGSFEFQILDAKRSDELGDLARAVERLGASVRLAMERFSR